MTTLLQISIHLMYVPGQEHVGVTHVCVIVVHHVKTLLLSILSPFYHNFNSMTMVSELVYVYHLFSENLPYCTICLWTLMYMYC